MRRISLLGFVSGERASKRFSACLSRSIFAGAVLFSASSAFAETPKEIERAFKVKLSEANECINILASKNKVVRASDVMRVTVDKNGIVKDFLYRSKDPDFLAYGACLKAHVMGTQLPKPSSGKAVTFATRINWKSPDDIQAAAGPQKEVADQIALKQPMFDECYNGYLRGGGRGSGKFVVGWTIGLNGEVLNLSVKMDEIGNLQLKNCLFGALEKMTFTPPAKKKSINILAYPLIFEIHEVPTGAGPATGAPARIGK